jgi:hypothetical protein
MHGAEMKFQKLLHTARLIYFVKLFRMVRMLRIANIVIRSALTICTPQPALAHHVTPTLKAQPDSRQSS